MTVSQFMQMALMDPKDGYYTNNNPFGRSGDFITAPEVSQLFGEMIGLWTIDIWQKMGEPEAFILAEAGPGRGTMMADILRTLLKLAPKMMAGMSVCLIETSDKLQKVQEDALSSFNVPLMWQSHLNDLPKIPLILLANEFLDALPIHQFVFQDGDWHERCVGVSSQGILQWGLVPTAMKPSLHANPQDGDIFEINTTAQTFCTDLSARLQNNKGAALFIDYGHLESSFGDTFQAMRDHRFVDVLSEPGKADLTAHVDFDPLMKIAKASNLTIKSTTQGSFLLAMGLLERAGRLGASLDVGEQKNIQNDVERLAAPDKMGNLFKVMAFAAEGIDPHGFD